MRFTGNLPVTPVSSLERRLVDEHRRIMKWLSPFTFSAKQKETSRERQEGTGQWLLEDDDFKNWASGAGAALWCHGPAGAGKPFLMSLVVDYLRQRFQDCDDIGIAYIYCDHRVPDTQSPVNLIGGILRQLLRHKRLSKKIKNLYNENVEECIRPTFHELTELLRLEVSNYSKVYLIFDALDEFSEERCDDRTIILDELKALQQMKLGRESLVSSARSSNIEIVEDMGVNLLISSRHANPIEPQLKEAKQFDILATPGDIRTYVAARISRAYRLSKFVQEKKELKEDIVTSFTKNPLMQGLFYPVRIFMDNLASKLTIYAVRQALKNPPQNMDDLHNETMDRVLKQEECARDLAEKTFYWVLHVERPLTEYELQHALAVEPSTTDIDEENIHKTETLTSVCQGLIRVEPGSKTIRFAHPLTEDYFRRVRSAKPTHAMNIASTCLTCLLFDSFTIGPIVANAFYLRSQVYPFYSYAAQAWGIHARGGLENEIQDLFLRLVEHKGSLISSIQAQYGPPYLDHGCVQPIERRVPSSGILPRRSFKENTELLVESWIISGGQHDFSSVTSLHLASRFGLQSLVELLLRKSEDVNSKGEDGTTALHAAALNGHHECARVLLGHGARMDASDVDGATALHAAARNGHHECVRALLDFGASIDTRDDNEATALHEAAENGHLQCLRVLLDGGAHVNDITDVDLTALHVAASNGHYQCVEVLLKVGADTSAKDEDELTALDLATCHGHERTVKKLLEHEIAPRPGRQKSFGFEHLVTALECGYKDVVDIHLSWHSWTLQVRDGIGRTLLSHAAESGYQRAVQVLLSCEDVEVNSRDKDGRTPLWWAARDPQYNIVTALVNLGADVNTADVDEVTPLHVAATLDLPVIVAELLQCGADITTRDRRNLNAIDMAILSCSDLSATTLLANGARVSCGCDGMTALHLVALNKWTQEYGRGKATRKSGCNYHNLTIKDPFPLNEYWGEVPHSLYFNIIWLLLTKGFHLDACDKHKRTVLHYAVSRGLETLVQVLLDGRLSAGEHRDALINTPDEMQHTALHIAASRGDTKIAKLLIDEGASVWKRDCQGKTPQELAAEKGHDETARVLKKLEEYEHDLPVEGA